MSLATYDLFTDAEHEIYCAIISLINEIDAASAEEDHEQKVYDLIQKKKQLQNELSDLIKSHKGIPRKVRLQNVLDLKRFKDDEGNLHLPSGITWWTLRLSKRIAEFASEESRAMGLKHNDITFDKIIIKWKSLDILKQIVIDGFTMPILQDDNSVIIKHYHVMTASAGQLRTDKVQCISDEAWEKIKNQIECGMSWDVINKKLGINVNKLMAYTALSCSATDTWDFPIDKCIVIKDFEAPVTGVMKYIKPDYSFDIGEQTVTINHCDGIGMMLPTVSMSNFMVRGPWIKGLLSSFDYIKFCKVNNVPAKIKDFWGLEHDLINEDIQIMFTESQFKLAKYYDSWDHYKQCFKENHCHLCRTNYEEEWIPDTYINYQMLYNGAFAAKSALKNMVNLYMQGVTFCG